MPKTSIASQVEDSKSRFISAVLDAMAAQGISRVMLAERMRVPPSFVTKILRGRTNISIETMVKVARAVNCTVSFTLE